MRYQWRAGALCAAAIICIASAANAGIVNVQSILATEAKPGISGAIALSADWRTGNTDLLVASAAPIARYRAGRNLLVGIVRGEIGRSRGADIIFKTFEHLRYRYTLSRFIDGELFGQHEFDKFRRLKLRALVGMGPKVTLTKSKRFHAAVGVAYMLEYEQLRDDGASDSGQSELQHRASNYITGSFEIDERVQAIETFYIQPRLTDAGDIRLLNESQLVVKLTKKVSLTTTFTLSYDRRPPDTIEKLDTALKSGLTLEF